STRVPSHVESMPTQIDRMRLQLLAAARDRRVVRRGRRRQDHLYDCGQVWGSLMRHLRDLEPVEVPLLPRRVVRPTGVGLLIAAARGTNRLAAAMLSASIGAVDVAVVAPAAERKNTWPHRRQGAKRTESWKSTARRPLGRK